MDKSVPILTARELSIGYGKTTIAADISLEIRRGEVTALLGANGVGKSTLIKTLTNELPPLSGSISIEGKELQELSKKRLAEKIALVTADNLQIGGLRVYELVSLGRHPYTGFFGHLSQKDESIIRTAIENVNIAHKTNEYVANLSDGERQKALIARALAQTTPLILLDEPFSFLDPVARIEIFTLLKEQARANNIGILLSSHDVAQALRIADRIWLFCNCNITSMSAEEALHSDMISQAFPSEKASFSAEIGDFISTTTLV